MSADRWSVCPRCVKVAEAKREAAFKKAKEAYGKVDADKYLEMLRKAEGIETDPRRMTRSLREDYGQGLSGGVYQVSYRCYCNECGWSWEYEQQVETGFDNTDGTVHSNAIKKGNRK